MKTKWSLYLVSLHVAAVFSAIMALAAIFTGDDNSISYTAFLMAAGAHIRLERNRQ